MCRKYLVLAATLLFFTSNCFGQSGWVWVNPFPSGNALGKTQFTSANTGYILADKGSFLKSTDGGLHWTSLTTNTELHLYSLKFLNDNTGFVVGAKSAILKTINGGLNWLVLNQDDSNSFYGVSFTDVNTGWVCGTNGIILFTTNGGNDWTRQPSQTIQSLNSLCFINGNTGWCSSSSYDLFKTTNSGTNWNLLSQNFNFSNGPIEFIDSNTGWATGSYLAGIPPVVHYRLIKSTNGGNTWFLPAQMDRSSLTDFDFVDTSYGWIVGSDRIKTTDGGYSWFLQPHTSDLSVMFMNRNTGWITGDWGEIDFTSNGGANWIYRNNAFTYDNFSDMEFINESTGYLASRYRNLFKSINSGNNWSLVATLGGGGDFKIDFLDENRGWAITDNNGGKVYQTTNGGTTWIEKSIGNTGGIMDGSQCLKFFDFDNGIVATYRESCYSCYTEGIIYKTTNSGTNWQQVYYVGNNNNNNYLRSKFFIDQETGWVVGGGNGIGDILKTTNGGTTWSLTTTDANSPRDFGSVYFVDEMTGWICGRGGVMKTTNAGLSWFIMGNVGIDFKSICFVNHDTAWALSSSTDLFRTFDRGLSWNQIYNPCEKPITGLWFINQNTGFIFGYYGVLLKTTDGGNGFLVGMNNETSNLQGNSFVLSQNYPNPFNPQTKIKFDISKQSFAKLIIYDILGREVATLVNEELKPGTYSFDWDGSNYASGIYFYQLLAGDYVQTKRMVLMK